MIELAPKSENHMTYGEALLYCQFLDYNGYRDWRLPTYDEYLCARTIMYASLEAPGWWDGDTSAGGTINYRVQPVRDTTWYRYIICIIKTMYDRISTEI